MTGPQPDDGVDAAAVRTHLEAARAEAVRRLGGLTGHFAELVASSRSRTRWLTPDWVAFRRRAARRKCSSSATAQNVRRSFSSSSLFAKFDQMIAGERSMRS